MYFPPSPFSTCFSDQPIYTTRDHRLGWLEIVSPQIAGRNPSQTDFRGGELPHQSLCRVCVCSLSLSKGCLSTMLAVIKRKFMFVIPVRSRLRDWSRKVGAVVPFLTSPLILHTPRRLNLVLTSQGTPHTSLRFPPQFLDRTTTLNRVSPEFSQVTQMHTGGVHHREYADTGPNVLKVALSTGAAYPGKILDGAIHGHPSFPRPPKSQ